MFAWNNVHYNHTSNTRQEHTKNHPLVGVGDFCVPLHVPDIGICVACQAREPLGAYSGKRHPKSDSTLRTDPPTLAASQSLHRGGGGKRNRHDVPTVVRRNLVIQKVNLRRRGVINPHKRLDNVSKFITFKVIGDGLSDIQVGDTMVS